MKSQIWSGKENSEPEKKLKILIKFDPKSINFASFLVKNSPKSMFFGHFWAFFFEIGQISSKSAASPRTSSKPAKIFRTSSLLELVPRSRKLSLVPARSQNECFARSHTPVFENYLRSEGWLALRLPRA